jgi:hypothetical protein
MATLIPPGLIPQRLRDGQPGWRDHLCFRLAGVLALGGFAMFLRQLCWLQDHRPAVAANPAMLLGCLAAVVSMQVGLSLIMIGPYVLHQVDGPAHKRRF